MLKWAARVTARTFYSCTDTPGLSFHGTGPTLEVLKSKAHPPGEATGVKAHAPGEATGGMEAPMAEPDMDWTAGDCLRSQVGKYTFDVSVNDAVLMEDVDGDSDLLGIQPDDVLLKAQP